MKAMMKACLEELDANQEKLQTKTEAYPERLQANREKVENDMSWRPIKKG
jgi:hypothetical protein